MTVPRGETASKPQFGLAPADQSQTTTVELALKGRFEATDEHK